MATELPYQTPRRERRTRHWWLLGGLIATGLMIAVLRGLEPGPDRPEYHISQYLGDKILYAIRIAIITLAALWAGLFVLLVAAAWRMWIGWRDARDAS